jgi:hypothetical protein
VSPHPDSAEALVLRIERKAPEYFDLLTADSEQDFERAFNAILQRAIQNLETNAVNFEKLNEVGLSAVLAAGISVPGLTVTQEAHSNGHVDLTIDADHCVPARRKLGEAKIYDGYAYHEKGLTQLLGRYTTGREMGGLLLVFVKLDGIAKLVKKLRKEMDSKKPCKQSGPTRNHTLKWSFESTHELATGDPHEVSHVACNLSTSRTP